MLLGVGKQAQPVLGHTRSRGAVRRATGLGCEGRGRCRCTARPSAKALLRRSRTYLRPTQCHRRRLDGVHPARCQRVDTLGPVLGPLGRASDPGVPRDRGPHVGPLLHGGTGGADQRVESGAVPPGGHPQAVVGSHLDGLAVLAEGHQALERDCDVATRQVEPALPEHRLPGPLGVHAAHDHPPSGNLPQQRVDRVAHTGGVRVLVGIPGDAVHQQSGLLECRQDVTGAGVTRQPVRECGREHRLGGAAQQQVPLRGLHPREDLAGDEVRDAGAGSSEPAYDVRAARRRRARPRRQHHRRAPPLGLRPDGVDEGGVRIRHVHAHQLAGLRVRQPERVAADDGQVAEELRDELAQGEVPPGQQDHPQPVRCRAETGVEDPDGGRRQQVGIVHDDEGRRTLSVAGLLEEAVEGRTGLLSAVHPVRGLGLPLLEPARHTQGLAGARGGHEHRDPEVGAAVEHGPQLRALQVAARQPGRAGNRDVSGPGGPPADGPRLLRALARRPSTGSPPYSHARSSGRAPAGSNRTIGRSPSPSISRLFDSRGRR